MPIISFSETMKIIDNKKKRKKTKQKSNKDRKEERGDASYSERVKGES